MLAIKNEHKTINNPPPCLCNVILKTSKTLPTLLHKNATNTYQLYCGACGFKTHEDTNWQAVVADWFLSNRPDPHTKSCWVSRYNRQNGTAISLG